MRAALIFIWLAACGGAGAYDPALGSADGGADGGSDASPLSALYMPCQSNSDCASGLCNPYPAKGGDFCSNVCTDDSAATDCPPPGLGCNRMGVCKF